MINALVACEALMMASRFVLAPHSPNLRVPPLTDETSNYLYIWICRIGYVALYGYFLLEAALLLGLSKSAYSVLVNVLGLVIAWTASVLAARPPSARFTYGFKSSSILAALGNAAFLLVALGMGMLISSIARSQFVAGQVALITTFQGLVVAIPCVSIYGYLRNRVAAPMNVSNRASATLNHCTCSSRKAFQGV